MPTKSKNSGDLNPKDVKDLTKSLSMSLSVMKELSAYSNDFKNNICGAKSCLDEMSGKGKKTNSVIEEGVKLTEDQKKELEKINIAQDKSNKLLEQAKKKSKEKKELLKATLKTVGDMAGSAGFGGVLNAVSDIVGAFAKGGLLIGGISVVMSAVSFIFNKLIEIDKQTESIAQGLGRGGAFARGLAASSFQISTNLASYGIDIKEAGQAAVDLGKQFQNLDYVTGKNQQTIALMGKQLGIGSAASAKTLDTFMSMSGGSFQTAKNMASVAMQMARSAKLPLGAIMEDVSQNSEAASKYGGKFAQSTLLASAAAKKMGMSFGDIAKVADGLLDIENSVSKQFEAQVLLGKNVNLEQARYYALTGNTKKLTNEVLKQVGSQAEFEKMMPMQRQALADAIGISVEQLGKMVSRQKEGMSVEEKMYNLQKQSLDNQLLGSEKMISIASQIEGAITQLGYAILKALFDIDMGSLFKKSADLGENLVTMINKLTSELNSGKGELSDFIKSVKWFIGTVGSAVKIAYDWRYALLAILAVFASYKIISNISSIIAMFNFKTLAGITSTAKAVKANSIIMGTALASFLKPLSDPSLILGTLTLIGIAYAVKLVGEAIGAAAPVINKLFETLGGIVMTVIDTIGSIFIKFFDTIDSGMKSLSEILKTITSSPLQLYAAAHALGALAVAFGLLTAGSIVNGVASLFNADTSSQIGKLLNIFKNVDEKTVDSIKSLSNVLSAFSNVNASSISNAMHALSSGIKQMEKSGISIEKVSQIKFQSAYNDDQRKYNSESLKYLKVIALATTIIAEKGGANIRSRTLDADISNLLAI